MVKDKKVKYDDYSKCKKCSGKNKLIIKNYINSDICETETECLECEYKDYWAYGFYDNGQ